MDRKKYRLPEVRRELLFCPKCGYDLDQARPRRVGHLFADPLGETYWKGQLVELNATQRIIVNSLLTMRHVSRRKTDRGYYVSAEALAERTDRTIDSMKVLLTQIRNAFRAVDPQFNHIETSPGQGYRWAQQGDVKQVVVRFGGLLTLYDSGELLWLERHRFYLTDKQAAFMRVLMEAKGEWVTGRQMIERAGFHNTTGPNYHSVQLRRLFAKAEPGKNLIQTRSGGGRNGINSGGYRIRID